MTPLLRKFIGLNWILVLNMFALMIFGIFCIHSATWAKADIGLDSSWNKQVIWIAVGTIVFFGASLIDYRWVYWGGVPLYFIGLGLSALALISGDDVHGHHSWLSIGGLTFQPSQIAVAGGIIMSALILGHLHKFHPIFRNHFLRLGIAGVVCVVPFGLVLLQGDFGSAMVWLPIAGAMLLVGSIPFRYIITVVLVALMFIPWAFFFGLKPHQKERITVFIDMLTGKEVDTQGSAYAASYIIRAVGSGGFDGRGYMNPKTINNLGFIPKRTAHNDFVFAVLAEEHGFRGSILLLAGYALMLLQGLFIGFYSRDPVGRLICVGVVALFFAHIFQHVGMNLLIMPITGIPLPFISYGGTFLVICMFLVGMMQSVWVHRANAMQRVAEGVRHAPAYA